MSLQPLPAQAEQLFHYLFEQASLGIAVEDLEGKLLLANPALCSMLGYTEKELCGMSCSEFANPEDSQDDWALFQQLRAGVIDHYSMEKRYLRKDGSQIWGRLNVSLSKNGDGEPPLVFAFVEEITARRLADQELARTNERLRLALEAGKTVGWEWDIKSGRDRWCGDLRAMFGIPSDTFVGKTEDFYRYVHPEDRQLVAKAVADARENRKPYAAEFRVVRLDGTVRWIAAKGSFYYGPQGNAERMLGMATDITEHRQTEERLREYEKAVEGSEEIMAVIDREYRYLIANRKFLKLRNMTKEQVVGRLVPEILNKRVFEAVIKEKLDECFAGKVVRYEMKYAYPEIGERDLLVSYFPIEGAAGMERVVCILQDITESKRSAEALRASEERFRLAAQAGKMYAYEWDVATDKVMRSEEHVNVLGFSDHAKHLTRQELLSSVHPDDRALFIGSVDQLTSQNPTTQISYRVLRPDGSVVWLEKNARAFFDEQGRMLRVIGMVADITERKRVESALEKSEEKFSKAFRQSPMALALTNAKDHHYIDVNETFERITGWRRDEVIGRTPFDIGLWVDPAERVEITKRLLAEGSLRNLELRFRMRDGSVRVGSASAELIELDGQPCVLGVTADVTEHKRAEEALRESEDKLRLLLDSTAEAIYGIDLEHRCTFCNPACVRALGYKQVDEVLGKKMHDLIHHSRADGTLFPVEECRIHSVIRTGEGVHAEDEVLWRANGTSFPAEYWSYPQRRGHDVVGAVVAFIDITERKLAEVALANVSRRLIEAQEQERTRIGRELHDDIVQRLALLAVELQQLHDNSLILPKVRSRMGKLQKQTSEIATDIQSLSHELHSAKLQYLGIAGAMRGFCREFGEQQKVEIDFHAHDLLSPLSPDTSLCFFRVLQEALHNAVKHSGVRHFEVRLWGTSDEIHLTVQDSGAGFDRKAAKASRGLGLISMEERLKLVNGTLSIDSQPKRGTTLHARVPLNSGSDSMSAAG
jgi:PAS domain S-box-containing protein